MPNPPNADQAEYWNAAKHWVEEAAGHDEMLAPLGRLALDALDCHLGDRVIDVGCGTGATTRELAAAVGPAGRVLGVDVSALLLATAREVSAGVSNVSYLEADAQRHRFEPAAFDRAYSRFGVMFFADPVAAFANVRTAVVDGGHLAFVCWQAAEQNEWVRVPLDAVRDRVEAAFDTAAGPNPFAFGDQAYVKSVLEAAGFSAVEIRGRTVPVLLGGAGDLETGLAFVMSSRVGRQTVEGADPSEARARVAAIRSALEPFVTPDGVRIDAAVWVVTARA